MNRVEQMKKIQNEALELFTKKNADYGDAFAKYGTIGVLMRIEDKLQRTMSITKSGVPNSRASEVDLQPPITNSPATISLLIEKTSGIKLITYIFSGALTPSSSSPFEIT